MLLLCLRREANALFFGLDILVNIILAIESPLLSKISRLVRRNDRYVTEVTGYLTIPYQCCDLRSLKKIILQPDILI
jgi:hypothetical protein